MTTSPLHTFLLVAFSASVGGCATFDALTYKDSPSSAQPKGTFEMALVAPNTPRAEVTTKAPAFMADEDLLRKMEEVCKRSPPKQSEIQVQIAPPLVPVVAALAQLAFEQAIANQERRVERIVDSAKATYSTTIRVSPNAMGALTSYGCVVALRYTSREEPATAKGEPPKTIIEPHLSVLLKLTGQDSGSDPKTQVVSFQPIYVKARTAVAGTKDVTTPTVSLSFALSIKAIARDGQSPIRRLVSVGESVTTVSNVAIGKNAKSYCSMGCPESDLMGFPTDAGTVSLSLAVAEQGNTGFDDKAAAAELAALKAAIGPAISEAVKAKYSPE